MNTLNQITIVLVSSIFFGAVLKFLRQPIFLAHIIVGLFVGTYFLNDFELTSSNQYFEIIVSLLLFISGLSINLKHIKELGENVLVKNILAFMLLTFFFYIALTFLGFEILEGVVLSICLTLSSSVILNKIVHDDLLYRNLFNKLANSQLLIQSFFLIFILVFLNSFSITKNSADLYNLLVNNLVKTLILIVNLFLVSKYIISRFEKFIATSNEFLFLFVIGFGFGVVSLFKFLNLSYELGALVAGILLSMHNFSFEVTSKLKVIREISLLGFFVFLGAGVKFSILSEKFLLIFVLLFLILFGKILLNLTIEKIFNTSLRENFFSSLSLTSISEFSLVIILLASANGLLNTEIFSIFGFLYIILTVINTYLIKHRAYLFDRYFDFLQIFKVKFEVSDKVKSTDVILMGCGKLGYDFLENYKYLKSKFLVIDYDFDVLKVLDKLKINNLYGDLSDAEFFETLPYLNSKLIYLSVGDRDLIIEILKRLKARKYAGVKVVVSYAYEDTLEFYRLGADYVVMPEFVSGRFVSDLTLNLGFDSKKYLREKASHLESLKIKESHSF
jgi:Kef-type K+ transport system membrane component KefB